MFLDYSYIGFVWLVVGLIFLLLELTTPGLFLFIAFALGCVLTSLFAFLNFTFMFQCSIFILGFVLSIFILSNFVKSKEKNRINTNVDALKGKIAIVIKTIKTNKKGLVKVGGEVWSAFSFDGTPFEKDSLVKIIGIKGSTLIVK